MFPFYNSFSSVMAKIITVPNGLTFVKGDNSDHYNQGFSDGYQGIPMSLKHHSQDYINGYKNGVKFNSL